MCKSSESFYYWIITNHKPTPLPLISLTWKTMFNLFLIIIIIFF